MMMTLQDILAGLVAGTLTGPLVFWFLNLEAIKNRWSGEAKRYFALFAPLALASIAFAVSVQIGYVENPGDPLAWIEALVLILSNIIVSQVAHARSELTKKAPAPIQ
jgi:hypothetical protein